MRMTRETSYRPDSLIRPPCWPPDTNCPNPCAAALHERITTNTVALTQQWAGWRLAGRDLVSPDGLRVNPQRLRGLIWRQQAELRREQARARNVAREKAGMQSVVTVIRIKNSDWHRERFGTSAG